MIDDLVDWFRLLYLVISAACLTQLIVYWHKHYLSWSKGTRQDWFLWFAWGTATIVFAMDGITRDLPFSLRPVILFVLSCVMAYLIFFKDRWSSD